MNQIKFHLLKWSYRMEYRFSMVDAYLAQLRGDKVETANFIQLAKNAKEHIKRLDLNRRLYA